MLEGDVEVGEDGARGHQGDDAVDVRVGVDVMEADPGGGALGGAQPAHLAGEVGHVGADFAAVAQLVGRVLQVEAVGAGVLADDQQFLGPGGDQFLGLAEDGVGAAADEVAAQGRDDAEGAAVIAALGNLDVAVVARGELEPGLGDQVDVGRGDRRGGLVDGGDDLLILLRAGDGQHVGEAGADELGLVPQAAGDDDAAVLGDGLADRLQALLLGAVEETAGVDQDDVGAGIIARHLIALGAQPGQDPLGIDQGLGAAKRDHADARRGGKDGCHDGSRGP